jgi:hypothetical protein
MSETDGIDAVLRHLGSNHDLQDFPGTTAEKLGLVRTAGARRLIAWNKARSRYELTAAGWRRTTPRRGLGVAPLVISATIGAAIGAGALAVLWPSADASYHSVGRHTFLPVSRPVDADVGLGMPAPPPQLANALPAAPAVQYEPPPPSAQQSPPVEPVKVAEQPAPQEPGAEPTSTITKQFRAKKHHHRKTSRARMRRAWAWANPYRDERYPRFGRIFR